MYKFMQVEILTSLCWLFSLRKPSKKEESSFNNFLSDNTGGTLGSIAKQFNKEAGPTSM